MKMIAVIELMPVARSVVGFLLSTYSCGRVNEAMAHIFPSASE